MRRYGWISGVEAAMVARKPHLDLVSYVEKQVGISIPIDIPGQQGGDTGKGGFHSEVAGSIIQQEADGLVHLIEDGQIRVPIPVQVRQHESHRAIAGGNRSSRLKSAVAIAEKHRYVIPCEVGSRQIGETVAIEVGHYQGARGIAARDLNRGSEGAVAVSLQDRNCIAFLVRDREIGNTVAIKVSGNNSGRMGAHGVVVRWRECTPTLIQENGHASVGAGNGNVVHVRRHWRR